MRDGLRRPARRRAERAERTSELAGASERLGGRGRVSRRRVSATRRMSTYKAHEGALDATGMRIAIVAGRFNDHITRPLLDGTLGALHDAGLDDVPVHWAPGAFEIPLVAQRLAGSGGYDAVICLGA